jgi:3-deoxy-D-manno-octulosonic-acid transferase
MYLLYSLCLWVLSFALLPYFLYQAARNRKYSGSFKQRMGRLPDSVRNDGRETIWIHAVSVGEFLAARVLIKRIASEFPGWRLVISTTTLSGQRLARSQIGSADVFYFPFDWVFAVRRALDWVKPRAVVILETEIWPNFLRECRRRRIATVLANGRISLRSSGRYKLVRRFICRVTGDFSLLIMQSAADVTRVFELGARAQQVRLCGNLKYDAAEVVEEPGQVEKWLGWPQESRNLIVAGSTSEGEERVLLEAFRKTRENPSLRGVRLLIAPRHPERFDEVATLIEDSGFSFMRRTELDARARDASTAEVILLDSIGELAHLYRYGAVVFVGGSLVPRGGHNVIEPAAWARPIVVGPYTDNFRQIVADFVNADAIIQIGNDGRALPSRLAEEMSRLLTDRRLAEAMGERALALLKANRGAADCTLRAIREVLRP